VIISAYQTEKMSDDHPYIWRYTARKGSVISDHPHNAGTQAPDPTPLFSQDQGSRAGSFIHTLPAEYGRVISDYCRGVPRPEYVILDVDLLTQASQNPFAAGRLSTSTSLRT